MFAGFVKTISFPVWGSFYVARSTVLLSSTALKWALSLKWRREGPTSHGDAKWAGIPELKKLGHLKHTGGFYVGRMYKGEWPWRSGRRRIFTDAESSVLMVGRKGSGKSQSTIADIRAIKLCPEALKPDLISIDPTGEIQAATEASLRAQGYDIRVIDLNDGDRSEQYDPLGVLRPGMKGYDFMLGLVGKSIIPESVKQGSYDHFPNGARGALMASIAFHQTANPHGCTLAYCMERIATDRASLQALLDLMKVSPSAVIRNSVKALEVVSPKEFGSFVSTMAGYFGPYLYSNVTDTYRTRADEHGEVLPAVEFLEIFRGSRKTAVFIRTGLYGKETGPYVRLILSNAINTKRWLLNQWHKGRDYHECPGLQRPCKIYTDETKNLGNATALEEANDELRKARVNTLTTWLSRADIYNNMSGAKNLIGGSVLVLAGGNNDHETNADMSRLIGDKTIYSRGGSHGRGGSSESYHEQGILLIKPEAIRQIPKAKRLIIMDQIQLIPDNPWEKNGRIQKKWTGQGINY